MIRKIVTAALLSTILFSCGAPEEQPQRPNIILVVIDTLRARSLSCYGYEREITPNIDSLAVTGVLWTNCTSQASWTLPSFTSMLTGTTERSHGAGRREDRQYVMHSSAPYLPVFLRDAGYDTYAIFNVIHLNEEHGFKRGFNHFQCFETDPAGADRVTMEFTGWLDERGESDTPFFALLHFFDPHMPYDPPAPFDTLFAEQVETPFHRWRYDEEDSLITEDKDYLMDLYDGEIAFTDGELGILFSHLRASGLSDNTIVIVTADHGEEFLEHGSFYHGYSFYQETIHVPLIMSGPGLSAGKVDSSWVGLFDLTPTILGFCGIEPSDEMEGIDLMVGAPPGRVIPSSGLFSSHGLVEPWVCAVNLDGMKTLRFEGDSSYIDLLADLPEDPMEALLQESGDSEAANGYMLRERLWTPVEVDVDLTNPVLRDLGYF